MSRGAFATSLACALLAASCEETRTVEGVDLSLSRIVIPGATSLVQGSTIVVQVVIRSSGTEPVPAGFTTRLTFYEDAALTTPSPVWAALSWIQPTEVPPGESVVYTGVTTVNASSPPQLVFCLAECDCSEAIRIREADETNNSCLKACQVLTGQGPAAQKPDLTVKSFAVPVSVERGSTFQAAVTIRNAGSVTAAAPFSVKVEAFSDAGRTIQLWEPQTVVQSTDLAALEEATFQVPFTARLSDPLQTVYMLATVDSLAQVSEASETNNTAEATTVIVLPPEPDLNISTISVPSQIPRGSVVNVSVRVRNSGGGTATAPFFVSLGAYSDEACTVPFPGHPETSWEVTVNLPPEGELAHDFPFAAAQTDPLGPVYFKALADSTFVVDEASEANNSATATSQIVTPAKPDLIVEITSCTDPFELGGSAGLAVGCKVTNAGSAGALGSLVLITILNDAGELVETFGPFGVGPLAAGASQSFTQNLDPDETNPLYHKGFHHVVSVIADYNFQISEEDETNNTDSYVLMIY